MGEQPPSAEAEPSDEGNGTPIEQGGWLAVGREAFDRRWLHFRIEHCLDFGYFCGRSRWLFRHLKRHGDIRARYRPIG